MDSSSTGVEPASEDSTDTGVAESSSTGSGTVCGDGQVDEDEVCDDGTNDGRYGGCQPGCGAFAPACGDGNTDDGEGCDDGNTEDGDGCNAECVASGTVLWTASAPGWEVVDLVNLPDGQVLVALSNADLQVDELSIGPLSLDGEFGDAPLVFDDVATGWTADLHGSGHFVLNRGGELSSYDQDSALWTFELPFFPPLTTERYSVAAGDGGAFTGFRDYQGGSHVRRFDPSGASAWQFDLPGDLLALDVATNGSALALVSTPLEDQLAVTSYLNDGEVEFSSEITAQDAFSGVLRASSAGGAVCWRREDGDTYDVATLSDRGLLSWSGSFGDGGRRTTYCVDVTMLEGGDLAVLERVIDGFAVSFALRRVSDGASIWEVELEPPVSFAAGRVIQDSEGKLLVAGRDSEGAVVMRLEP